MHGGVLKDRKGMNLPGVAVSAPGADREGPRRRPLRPRGWASTSSRCRSCAAPATSSDLQGADAPRRRTTPSVIAKIEKPEALDYIDEILDAADGVMVARGDLGVEMPPRRCRSSSASWSSAPVPQGKPVIVATQMLESMIEHPRPTRAEVSDVSTAVFVGADAVMLSAETASGAYPVRAVEMMDRVARRIESQVWTEGRFATQTAGFPGMPLHDAIARAVAQLSRDLRIRAIVAFTTSGKTAGVMAAARPAAPLVAVSTDVATVRRSNLLWGAVPVLVTDADLDDATATARRLVREHDLAEPTEYVLTLEGLTADGSAAASMTVLVV